MRIQDKFTSIGKYGCLAMCYIYAVADALGIKNEMREPFVASMVLNALEKNIIDDDCFVKNPIALMQSAAAFYNMHIKANVTKKEINGYTDVSEHKYACVRHDFNGKSHWVLAKDGWRIFDSLEDSQCVKNGKPVSARIIDLEIMQ